MGQGQLGQALVATLVLVALVVIAVTAHGWGGVVASPNHWASRQEVVTRRVLARAKEALVAWAVTHPYTPGQLPFPDRSRDGNHDGYSDCVTRGFSDGHLFGRFPERGTARPCRKVDLGFHLRDGSGAPLWYAVSRNLVRFAASEPINPDLLERAQHPWLLVRRSDGRVLTTSDGRTPLAVAAVVIAPGRALAGQHRSAKPARPRDYCEGRLVDGEWVGNDDYDGEFIMGEGVYSARFNDRIAYLSVDELLARVQSRVLSEVVSALRVHAGNEGIPLAPAPRRAVVEGTWGYSGMGFGAVGVRAGDLFLDRTNGVMARITKIDGDQLWGRQSSLPITLAPRSPFAIFLHDGPPLALADGPVRGTIPDEILTPSIRRWYRRGEWHRFVSYGYCATSCLSVEYARLETTHSPQGVRRGVKGVIVGAGSSLENQQNRRNLPCGYYCEYFEDHNRDSGTERYTRGLTTDDFNDQLRTLW